MAHGECVLVGSELDLHVDWTSISIDFLARSKNTLLLEIGDGIASSVAGPVVGTAAITSVWSSSPGVSVCFHDVKFWAVLACNVVGVAVVVAIGVMWLTIRTSGWKRYGVEGSDTPALLLGKVDIVLN